MTNLIYQIYWTLMKYHQKNDKAEQKLEEAAKPLPEINGGKADKLETTLQTEIIILESAEVKKLQNWKQLSFG